MTDRSHRTKLSVNLNKVAIVRNSRGGNVPDLVTAARIVIDAGADGITVHPRADARHIRLDDLDALAAMPEISSGRIELNVEGDLRPDLIDAVVRVGAAQYTVVPVTKVAELTTTRGWNASDDQEALRNAVSRVGGRTRVSVFVDVAPEGIRLAAAAGARAIEFHTRDYAAASGAQAEAILGEIRRMAELARSLGLRVNAGHDLTPQNLGPLLAAITPEEVSIGHALVSQAVLGGLAAATGEYLQVIHGQGPQSREPKYLIFHLVRHTEGFYSQDPEEESKSQIEVNDFIKSWYPRVKQMIGAHAMGMAGEWDWMGVFGVDELSDWEAFREEYKRRFPGRTEKNLSMPGVSHTEFVRATDQIEHYRALRKMGVFPGQAEIKSDKES